MRIRTTRPEYYTSPTVGEMSWDARLVFHHLWSYVEDNGVNYDSPKLIKSMCMPYDGDQVVSRIEDALDELEKLDCVIRYERDGHRLLFLPGFRKWQKVPHPGTCHFLPPSGYDRQGHQVSHESLTTSTESLTTSRAFSSSRSSSNKKEEENKFSSSKEKPLLPPSRPAVNAPIRTPRSSRHIPTLTFPKPGMLSRRTIMARPARSRSGRANGRAGANVARK